VGDDIDHELVRIAIDKIASASDLTPEETTSALTSEDRFLLEREIEERKRDLNVLERTVVDSLGLELTLERADLEAAVAKCNLFGRVGKLIEDAIRRSILTVGLRDYPDNIPTPGEEWVGKTPEGIMVDSVSKLSRSSLMDEIDFVLFAGGVTQMETFRTWFAREFAAARRNGDALIVAEAGIPVPIERVAHGAASNVAVTLESIHRLPYEFAIRTSAGTTTLIDAYSRSSNVNSQCHLTGAEECLEIRSAEDAWVARVEIPWSKGTFTVGVDQIGRFYGQNQDPNGVLNSIDEPWRTSAQRQIEDRLEEEIARQEQIRKDMVRRNTDPQYSYVHDVH
jgi:hypothetical protein